jgi:hypothetical protein
MRGQSSLSVNRPSNVAHGRISPEDGNVGSSEGNAYLMTPSQEDGRWPHAELQFGRLSGNKRLGVAAEIVRGWAMRIIRTFVRIHLLAVDSPEFSLIQISDVAIGRDIFQIAKKRAVRRCGSDFEDYDGRPRNFYIRSQWSASIHEEFAVFGGSVRVENI